MNKLVLGNLLHRPIRVAISVLAVAIEVIMILSITGVFIGQVSGNRANTLGVGADMVSSRPMPASLPPSAALRFRQNRGHRAQASPRCRC